MCQVNSSNIHRLNLEQCLGETNFDYLLEQPSICTSMEQYQEFAAIYFEKIRQEEVVPMPRSRTYSGTSSLAFTDTSSYNPSLKASRDSYGFDTEPQMPSNVFERVGYRQEMISPQVPAEEVVYQVQFKHNFRDYSLPPGDNTRVVIGSFVVVKCEFGEDIGVVTGMQSMSAYIAGKCKRKPSIDREDDLLGVILGLATLHQRQFLPVKLKKEAKAMKTVLRLTYETYKLPMKIIGVEYQADCRKLTVHYVADVHIDFRDLVKDLFSLYRVRIWMKLCRQDAVFTPKKFATLSLTTGMSYEENWEKHMY